MCGKSVYDLAYLPDDTKCENGILSFTFEDFSRDYKTYKAVVIGSQIWMAQNLNYDDKGSGSKCYGEGELILIDTVEVIYGEQKYSDAEINDNCKKYGRLYDWETAVSLDNGRRGICPFGWNLPSDDDWETLMQFINQDCSAKDNCSKAGGELKATSGWSSGNGNDKYGFAALPGGEWANGIGVYRYIYESGGWWSSTEDDDNPESYAYGRDIMHSSDKVFRRSVNKEMLFSVRCVKEYWH